MEIFWKIFILLGVGWPLILIAGFVLFILIAPFFGSSSSTTDTGSGGDSGGDYSSDSSGGRDD